MQHHACCSRYVARTNGMNISTFIYPYIITNLIYYILLPTPHHHACLACLGSGN